MPLSRRDVMRASIASLAGLEGGCRRRDRARRDGGRVVVEFWYAFGDRVRKTLLDLVAHFNESQGRVLVLPVHQGDYFESLAKLRTAIAAGGAPALSHVVLEVLPYLARAAVLEPLDQYDGARSIPFLPSLTQAGSFRSPPGLPTFGVPFNRSTPIAFANGRAFAQAGAALPATWEDLVRVATRLTLGEGDGGPRWGFEVPISWWYWVAMVGQAGGTLVDGAGRVTLGGEAGEKALRFWQRLVRDLRVMRPPPGRDYQAWQSTNEAFLGNRVAMMWSSTAYVRYLEDNASFPVVAAPLPREARTSVPTGGTMFVLLRAAPDDEKRAAWEFVRWMCAVEQTTAWSRLTGYLPVTTVAVDVLRQRRWYEVHPNDRVAYDQLASAEPWPWDPELFRIERDIVEPRLEEAVLSGRDAHEVLDEARDEAARHG
ncbi:MAG: ABC transporter substrate-binding protein [Polyangiaceae bacterium]